MVLVPLRELVILMEGVALAYLGRLRAQISPVVTVSF